MREILFRAKSKDNGRWYKGQYINLHKTTYCFKEDYEKNPSNDIHQIVYEEIMDWGLPNKHLRVDVIPETIGEFTGIFDIKGKRIFEGDILCKTFKLEWDNNEERKVYYVVKFHEGMFATFYKDYENGEWVDCEDDRLCKSLIEVDNLEIVGNVYDNPELLGGVICQSE